jgi:hypothetical protein
MTPDDWFIERIEEYLDGELTEGEREEFERKIAGDPACRAEIDEAERFRRLAREARPIPIPDELGLRIRERLSREQPARRGRIVWLRWLVTGGVAAAILFMLLNPVGPLDLGSSLDPGTSPAPVIPVVRLGEPGTPSPLTVSELLDDWLDQAKNINPADAELLVREAWEHGLLVKVRSRLTGARGRDRTWLLAAEDLLIQVENGISSDALPMEAQLVAMARN